MLLLYSSIFLIINPSTYWSGVIAMTFGIMACGLAIYQSIKLIPKLKVMKKSDQLTQYLNLLKSYDWYYQYSDDHRVYVRGINHNEALRKTYEKLSTEEKHTAFLQAKIEIEKRFKNPIVPLEFETFKGI